MVTSDDRRIITVPNPQALAEAAANRLIERMDANGGRIAICLTGGSSPKQLYQLLASDAYRGKIPWNRVHWFIGDERFVPPDDDRNNMAMARRTVLDRLAPPSNIHPIETGTASPDESAHAYEGELKAFYGAYRLDSARPLFDLVLMGLGPDGHTASLFPNSPALDERQRWALGIPKAGWEPFVPRVTLTFPALASTHEMLFLVDSADKRQILARVLGGEDLPAHHAYAQGDLVWLIIRAAAPER